MELSSAFLTIHRQEMESAYQQRRGADADCILEQRDLSILLSNCRECSNVYPASKEAGNESNTTGKLH